MKYFKKNEIIFNHGDQNQTYYVILKGEVNTYVPYTPDQKNPGLSIQSTLHIGDGFGEKYLINKQRCAESAICTQDCYLIVITKIAYETILCAFQ